MRGTSRFQSYFSGNTVQICPVGALTGAAYRFRSRPFDLVSVAERRASTAPPAARCAPTTAAARCCAGWRGRTRRSTRSGTATRAAGPSSYATQPDRLPPRSSAKDGELVPASWPEALARAADGLRGATAAGVGVLAGGRLPSRTPTPTRSSPGVALDTNDIDFRARPHSREEAEFLAAHVAGAVPARRVTYADLDTRAAVLLVGFEPEDESPIVFLRLRKAARVHKTHVVAIAPMATRGLRKCDGTLLKAAPHTEPEFLRALAEGSSRQARSRRARSGRQLREAGRGHPRRRAARLRPRAR